MQLTWYGHAAFLLENNASFRVILDPYRSPGVGTYAPIDDWADLVAISHQNETYHSFVQGIRGRDGDSIPILMDGLKLLTQNQPQLVEKIPFTATEVYENEERKEPIAMVGVTMDGLCILHMGDCGHKLSAEETAACGAADVLLALAGGAPTLALPDLVAFIENLQPKIVIPMHFGNNKINLIEIMQVPQAGG